MTTQKVFVDVPEGTEAALNELKAAGIKMATSKEIIKEAIR
jgi:hypothetical protein